ncbi:MAG: DUF4837 family protein [Paludibacteraceae bacterium]|nr:DUF4837 family protein [Paludibacteraceae bacterium]
MRHTLALLISAVALMLQSCDTSILKPSISGAPYEVLVVAEDNEWKSETGKAVYDMLNSNMPGTPQQESMFKISHVTPQNFTNTINIARNILIFNVSDKYSKAKLAYRKDAWAQPQAVVQITAPNNEAFVALLDNHHENICEYFVDAERKRQAAYYQKYYNTENTKIACETFGIETRLPANQIKSKMGKDFFWSSNMNVDVRQDVIIYTFPYTDPDTFTEKYLLDKRDSVLKANIPGPSKGSYMATERQFPPIFKSFKKNDSYCAEIRGWWKVEGDLMGGPFIAHWQVDEKNGRVVCIEGFVYAPGQSKRNFIRQLEAVVYATKIKTK